MRKTKRKKTSLKISRIKKISRRKFRKKNQKNTKYRRYLQKTRKLKGGSTWRENLENCLGKPETAADGGKLLVRLSKVLFVNNSQLTGVLSSVHNTISVSGETLPGEMLPGDDVQEELKSVYNLLYHRGLLDNRALNDAVEAGAQGASIIGTAITYGIYTVIDKILPNSAAFLVGRSPAQAPAEDASADEILQHFPAVVLLYNILTLYKVKSDLIMDILKKKAFIDYLIGAEAAELASAPPSKPRNYVHLDTPPPPARFDVGKYCTKILRTGQKTLEEVCTKITGEGDKLRDKIKLYNDNSHLIRKLANAKYYLWLTSINASLPHYQPLFKDGGKDAAKKAATECEILIYIYVIINDLFEKISHAKAQLRHTKLINGMPFLNALCPLLETIQSNIQDKLTNLSPAFLLDILESAYVMVDGKKRWYKIKFNQESDNFFKISLKYPCLQREGGDGYDKAIKRKVLNAITEQLKDENLKEEDKRQQRKEEEEEEAGRRAVVRVEEKQAAEAAEKQGLA